MAPNALKIHGVPKRQSIAIALASSVNRPRFCAAEVNIKYSILHFLTTFFVELSYCELILISQHLIQQSSKIYKIVFELLLIFSVLIILLQIRVLSV